MHFFCSISDHNCRKSHLENAIFAFSFLVWRHSHLCAKLAIPTHAIFLRCTALRFCFSVPCAQVSGFPPLPPSSFTSRWGGTLSLATTTQEKKVPYIRPPSPPSSLLWRVGAWEETLFLLFSSNREWNTRRRHRRREIQVGYVIK